MTADELLEAAGVPAHIRSGRTIWFWQSWRGVRSARVSDIDITVKANGTIEISAYGDDNFCSFPACEAFETRDEATAWFARTGGLST